MHTQPYCEGPSRLFPEGCGIYELGAKFPGHRDRAVRPGRSCGRVMAVKTADAGQICLAPDCAFVPHGKQRQFADACVTAVKTMFPDGLYPEYTSIVNACRFARLAAMVEDARRQGAEIIEMFPASKGRNERRFPPTLLIPRTSDVEAMREEIFGPVLPILGHGSIEEVINRIEDGPHPLALSLFRMTRLPSGSCRGCVGRCHHQRRDGSRSCGGPSVRRHRRLGPGHVSRQRRVPGVQPRAVRLSTECGSAGSDAVSAAVRRIGRAVHPAIADRPVSHP